jgi:copper transport protein
LPKRVGDKCSYYCRYLPIIIIASLLFLSYTLISTIPHAYAHAYVIGSDPFPSQSLPKAPSNVVVHLSEPVDIRYSSVKVLGPGGNQIDKKDSHYVNGDHTTLAVTLPAGVKDGVYTVSTKMLSETDGHVTENAFVFGVGHAIIPSTVPNASAGLSSLLYIPEAIARFPTLVGQVIIVGGAFATLWLWRPIARIDWLANTLDQVRTKIDKRIAILMVIGAAILLASDFGMIYAEAKSIDISIVDAIGTKFGSLWVYRLATSIVLMCLSVLLFITQRKDRKNKGGRTQKSIIYGLLGVGLIALLTTSLIGHGAALNPASVPILIDFVHNLAASLWIGGVIYLAFVVVPGIKQSHKDEYIKASLLSLLIPRFSTIPVVILGTIVITGPFLLYLLEPDLGLTFASLYGKALIAKLILAGVMIGIGAYNQSIIHRDSLKMVAVTSITSGSDAFQKKGSESTIDARLGSIDNLISKFGKSTKAEAFVGIALLAAVAVLVNTGLPASEFQNLIQQVQQQQQQSIPGLNFANGIATPQQGFTATNYIGNNQKVTLSINPYTPGNNKFQIVYSDSNGNPIDIKSVQLRYTQTDKGIGPITVDTDKVSKGIFSVNAAFGLAGPWDLQVEATPAAANAPDIVTEYNLFVKPKFSDFSFNVKVYKIHSTNAQPLFPLYDKSRNVVWSGDSGINSGRIWEFSLTNHTYTEHKIAGTNIITLMAFDPTNNDIWFIDPLNKNLGHYDHATGTTQLFKIPVESVLSGIAIDPSSTNIWVSLATANEVLRFNILEKTFSTPIKLPSQNATPLDIIADQSGQIWVAESGTGKLANIDPTKNNKVTEFVPTGGINNTLKSPTALLADPNSGQIYISEHDGHTVSVFNPILRTFSKNPPLNPSGLPFGMALDNYRNLWVAEHVINKISVIDPSTGEHSEVRIPQQSPFVQWITADSQGNIWMAEQRAASLGQITIIAKPSLSGLVGSQTESSPAANSNNGNKISLPTFGFSYAEFVGPSVAAGIVVSALFYAKTIIDLKRSEQLIRKTAKVTRS